MSDANITPTHLAFECITRVTFTTPRRPLINLLDCGANGDYETPAFTRYCRRRKCTQCRLQIGHQWAYCIRSRFISQLQSRYRYEKWEPFVEINSKDTYQSCIVKSTRPVGSLEMLPYLLPLRRRVRQKCLFVYVRWILEQQQSLLSRCSSLP